MIFRVNLGCSIRCNNVNLINFGNTYVMTKMGETRYPKICFNSIRGTILRIYLIF